MTPQQKTSALKIEIRFDMFFRFYVPYVNGRRFLNKEGNYIAGQTAEQARAMLLACLESGDTFKNY